MSRLPERIEVDGLLLRRWFVSAAAPPAAGAPARPDPRPPWSPGSPAAPRPRAARQRLLADWERDWEAGGDSVFGIFRDGAVVGSCGLHCRRGPTTLEIGYWIGLPHLRRGFATEAAAALTEAGLAGPGITRMEIRHDRANVASAAIPRRLGYTLAEEIPTQPRAPAEVGVECVWRLG